LKPVLKLPPVQRLLPVDAIDVIFAGKKKQTLALPASRV
jgi:hypothetical protein